MAIKGHMSLLASEWSWGDFLTRAFQARHSHAKQSSAAWLRLTRPISPAGTARLFRAAKRMGYALQGHFPNCCEPSRSAKQGTFALASRRFLSTSRTSEGFEAGLNLC